MVEGARTTTPCRARSVLISTSVMSGLACTRARTRLSCASRSGRRCPPKRAGAAVPLSRTRRISFTAADGLTSKRNAARRIELPASTARTIRSRKSCDRGAGMARLTAEPHASPESDFPIPRNRNPL
jgi:hypothetical protein